MTIPRGSSTSRLIYNAELLDIYERPGIRTSGLGFVDETNVLACSAGVEVYHRTLERLYLERERCANRNGAVMQSKCDSYSQHYVHHAQV